MASTPKPKPSGYAPEEIGALNALCARLKDENTVFYLSNGEKLTTAKQVSFKVDPIFKVQLINGGQEFVFERVRLGKVGQMIFLFRPMDMQPYDYVEIGADKVFEILPNAITLFAGIEGFRDLDETTTPTVTFKRCLRGFIAQHLFDLEQEAKQALAELEKERREELSGYEDNPLFGAF